MAGGATFTVLLAGAGLTSASQRSSGGGGLCLHQPAPPPPSPAADAATSFLLSGPLVVTSTRHCHHHQQQPSIPDQEDPVHTILRSIWTGARIVRTITDSEPVGGAGVSGE